MGVPVPTTKSLIYEFYSRVCTDGLGCLMDLGDHLVLLTPQAASRPLAWCLRPPCVRQPTQPPLAGLNSRFLWALNCQGVQWQFTVPWVAVPHPRTLSSQSRARLAEELSREREGPT